MKKLFFMLCTAALLVLPFLVRAQSVGVSNVVIVPDPSSLLEIRATNKGVLLPQVALTGVNDVSTIASPATSLLVYCTGTGGLSPAGYYYNAGTPVVPLWTRFASSAGAAWQLTGNAGTVPGTDFIGTTDLVDWVIKTNNTERMRVLSGGNVGIGIALPVQKLHVSGNEYVSGDLFIRTNLGAGALIGSVHHGPTGLLGQSNGLNFSAGDGLWIEASHDGESGGLFLNGTTAILWSPGDADIFRVYDEDIFPTLTNPKFVINGLGYVGINSSAPPSLLSVGSANEFQVNSTGNLVRVNNIPYSWPAVQGVNGTTLVNNGAGNLSWASPTAGQQFATVYSTAAVTLPPNNTYYAIPGLTQAITVPAAGTFDLYIFTDGGATINSAVANVGEQLEISIWVDGVANRYITQIIDNTSNYTNCIRNWSTSLYVNAITPGAHTIAVQGRNRGVTYTLQAAAANLIGNYMRSSLTVGLIKR